MVLMGGEAGIGKTLLLRRFCEEASARVLWAACDPLFTPRPLGPLLDLARDAAPEPAEPGTRRGWSHWKWRQAQITSTPDAESEGRRGRAEPAAAGPRRRYAPA
jgi:hypothetical protein